MFFISSFGYCFGIVGFGSGLGGVICFGRLVFSLFWVLSIDVRSGFWKFGIALFISVIYRI